jgi:hypothetical protein
LGTRGTPRQGGIANADIQWTRSYDDWKGTAAADESDHIGIRRYLEERQLIRDEEFVVGLEMYSGSSLGGVAQPRGIASD